MKWQFFYLFVFVSLGLTTKPEQIQTYIPYEICEVQISNSHIPNGLPLAPQFRPKSRKFGMHKHPIFQIYKMHTGIDVAAPHGQPILATGDGVITKSEYSSSGYGNVVEITHDKVFKSRYAHCSKIIGRVGQAVEKGDTIALVGSTGQSTGNHLHYELLEKGVQVNPQKLIYGNDFSNR